VTVKSSFHYVKTSMHTYMLTGYLPGVRALVVHTSTQWCRPSSGDRVLYHHTA